MFNKLQIRTLTLKPKFNCKMKSGKTVTYDMTIILKSFTLFASKQLVEDSEMSSNTSFLVVLS